VASRARHIQMPYRRLNRRAQKYESRVIAIFRVFSGDFAVRMSALRESARWPASAFGTRIDLI
jgi:hypothetical protein